MRPLIFDYFDYRQFLRDDVEYLRDQGEFSNRKFMKKAGFKSPAHMRMILQGKRGLTKTSAAKVAKALELGTEASNFFWTLIQFNQAEDPETKAKYLRGFHRYPSFRKYRKATKDMLEYFSDWHHPVVREALRSGLAELPEDQFAKALGMTKAKLRSSLSLMERLDLIRASKSAPSGWEAADKVIETEPVLNSEVVRMMHGGFIRKALDSLESVSVEDRNTYAMTMALTNEDMQDISKRMFELLLELGSEFPRRTPAGLSLSNQYSGISCSQEVRAVKQIPQSMGCLARFGKSLHNQSLHRH